MHTVAVLVGSLRKESFNRQLALALKSLAKDSLTLNILPLEQVPMFNQDLEDDLPPPVVSLKQAVSEADGILLVTPEYNRSIPAVLKNALDWGSRPPGSNVWTGKPATIAGTSPGSIGTAVAQAHLRSFLGILGMCVMSQPEVYLTWTNDYFAADGSVADEKNRAYLQKFLSRFQAWIERHGTK